MPCFALVKFIFSKGSYGRTDSSVTISLRNFVGERIKTENVCNN
jgi:hypothetical protein